MTAVGVLGGTFDPVHHGHLQLAQAALIIYALDNIILVPAGRPPHKNNSAITAPEHRLHMLRSAIRGKACYRLSEIELTSSEPTYTFDTLNRLQDYSGEEAQLHFILGQDAFLEIETWYRWQALLKSRSIIIAVRPGYPIDGVEEILARNNFTPQNDEKTTWCECVSGNIIRILSSDIADISSTEIRRRIAEKLSWQNLVPEAVGEYIMDNGLYGAPSPRV